MLTLQLPRDVGAMRDAVAAELVAEPEYSHGAAARVFARWNGGAVRWVPELRAWALWDGARWRLGAEEAVQLAMLNLCCGISHCASADETLGRAARSTARACTSATFVGGALMLARGMMEAGVTTFDAEPWALNTAAGIVDLRTGELAPHAAERRCTRMAPVHYDPGVRLEGTRFERFLDEVFAGDGELIGFTQAAMGYCLTGDAAVHALYFWYGGGRNGKSTLGEAMLHAMGDYARKIESRVLMLSTAERHPAEVAQLRGVRLALSSEINKGSYWDEARIKEMTGDAVLNARGMRENFYTFPRTHKHLVWGNNKPRLKEVDPAIKARLKLTPFLRNFDADGTLDPRLPERLREEAAVVLRWAVEGAMRVHAAGVRLPESGAVAAATADYMDENDLLREWVNEQCFLSTETKDNGHPRVLTKSRDLYRAYAAWKRDRGEGVEGVNVWRQMMRAAGHATVARDGMLCFAGVGLLFNPEDPVGTRPSIERPARH